MLEINAIHCGDCLDLMPQIPDRSIDMILCDLPYGITACKWDTVIPLEPLWAEYKRVIKERGAIVLTASQPFTATLIVSNKKIFKYALVWDKVQSNDFQLANIKPLKSHEDILVFGDGRLNYYPQKSERKKPVDARAWKTPASIKSGGHKQFASKIVTTQKLYTEKYPRSVITINSACGECNNTKRVHPTQKPVALFAYLIKTYTNPGGLVLDNCIGSGTTAVACLETGRDFIGIEQEKKYVDIARKRIKEVQPELITS